MLHKFYLLACFAAMVLCAREATAAYPILTIANGKGTVGADVTIAVTAGGLNRGTAWGFNLSYDRDKLRFVSIQKGTATTDWSAVGARLKSGKLYVAGNAGLGTPISGGGLQLCTLTFHIDSDSNTTETQTLVPGNTTDGLRKASVFPGKITIIPAASKALIVGNGKGTVGTNVTISVTTGKMSRDSAWGFSLAFDRSMLQYLSLQAGTATTDWSTLNARMSGGKLWIAARADAGTPIVLNGNRAELCKITFYIKTGVGSAPLLTPGNLSDGLKKAEIMPGKITISAPTNP